MLTPPKSHRRPVHRSRFTVHGRCDAACRDADSSADACTCVCKGKNHGIAHRRGMDDLFSPGVVIARGEAPKQSHPCKFVKLNKSAA